MQPIRIRQRVNSNMPLMSQKRISFIITFKIVPTQPNQMHQHFSPLKQSKITASSIRRDGIYCYKMDQMQPPLVKASSNLPRRSHIDRIKTELKSFPLLSRNHTLVERRMTRQAECASDSPSEVSMEAEEQRVTATFEHAELFAEKYQITEKLGEGSNGVVHRCIKRRSGQQFAVKTFMFDDQQLPEIKANFLLVKGLRHKSLIRYQALYIDMKKHACWLVMEYFPARPLSAGSLTGEGQLRAVFQQLLETLHYLHQRAITHRDIKLQNILFDPQQGTLKLIDFGICRKHRRRGAKFQMLTITGTLFYRAPEMFTGGGYDEKVDVWSAGVLLFKMVAGRTPFQSEYHSQTISNILNAAPAFPNLFEAYSSSLTTLITRILNKNPRERPSALDALRESWFCITPQQFRQVHRASFDSFQDEQGLCSPVMQNLVQLKSYIRQINGVQFHCIDSDDQAGPRRVAKRQHRSMLVELGNFTL